MDEKGDDNVEIKINQNQNNKNDNIIINPSTFNSLNTLSEKDIKSLLELKEYCASKNLEYRFDLYTNDILLRLLKSRKYNIIRIYISIFRINFFYYSIFIIEIFIQNDILIFIFFNIIRIIFYTY